MRGASGYKCLKCGKKCVWDDFGRSSSPYFTFRNIFSLHVFKISDIHFHWPVWVQLPKRVVGWTIEETRKKLIFCMFLIVLLSIRRRRGAKSLKNFEKLDVLVVPGAENVYFRSERPNPIKNRRSKGGTLANRPSRIACSYFWGDPFVLCGARCLESADPNYI